MAQLRQDYQEFVKRDAEVVAVGPDSLSEFKDYWQRENLPFVGLADPEHRVARMYGQQVKWLKMGRMPALVIVDKQGKLVFTHYGSSMSDIPPNEDVLAVLDDLNAA